MDHDTGFAPRIRSGLCTLCGCKKGTIERWARPGSWVVGIGGNGTRQPDKLIYAMRVDEVPRLVEFRRRRPAAAAYLRDQPGHARVLVASRRFWYFGDSAVALPRGLERIMIRRQGCKRLSDEDVDRLWRLVLRRRKPGRRGEPNNRPGAAERTPC